MDTVVPETGAEGARTTIKRALVSPKFSVLLMYGKNSSIGREQAGEQKK